MTLPILQRRQLRLRGSEGTFTPVSSGWGQSREEAEIPSSALHPEVAQKVETEGRREKGVGGREPAGCRRSVPKGLN